MLINYSLKVIFLSLLLQSARGSNLPINSCVTNNYSSSQTKLAQCMSNVFGNCEWQTKELFNLKEDGDLFNFLVMNPLPPHKYFHSRKIGNENCTILNQTSSVDGSRSICPHHLVKAMRYDRYPFTVTYASCNCNKCLNTDTPGLGCKPKYINRPAFASRDECTPFSKKCIWDPIYERVPISCECRDLTNYD